MPSQAEMKATPCFFNLLNFSIYNNQNIQVRQKKLSEVILEFFLVHYITSKASCSPSHLVKTYYRILRRSYSSLYDYVLNHLLKHRSSFLLLFPSHNSFLVSITQR